MWQLSFSSLEVLLVVAILLFFLSLIAFSEHVNVLTDRRHFYVLFLSAFLFLGVYMVLNMQGMGEPATIDNGCVAQVEAMCEALGSNITVNEPPSNCGSEGLRDAAVESDSLVFEDDEFRCS